MPACLVPPCLGGSTFSAGSVVHSSTRESMNRQSKIENRGVNMWHITASSAQGIVSARRIFRRLRPNAGANTWHIEKRTFQTNPLESNTLYSVPAKSLALLTRAARTAARNRIPAMSADQGQVPSAEYQRIIAEMAELAGGLAHELRNPLSTMMINLKLLAEDLRDADAHPDDIRRRALLKVDTLRREAERLQSLFDEFLQLTGPFRLQRREGDISAVIRRLVEFVGPLAHSKNVEVVVEGADRPLVGFIDEKLLGQAVLNLVLNAQEAMPGGGRLTISAAIQDDVVQISVSDTGVGIAPEDRPRIFRPFFSTKRTGTGLGLSLTQRIIQEHGGTLEFTSEPGLGTTFTFRLPRTSG